LHACEYVCIISLYNLSLCVFVTRCQKRDSASTLRYLLREYRKVCLLYSLTENMLVCHFYSLPENILVCHVYSLVDNVLVCRLCYLTENVLSVTCRAAVTG